MRYLIIILAFSLSVTSCTTGKSGAENDTVYTPPTDLEGPAYDPSDSPIPMTASTPLPVPPGAQPTANTYEQQPLAQEETPYAYSRSAKGDVQQQEVPPTSLSAPAPATYGDVAAPTPYSAPAAAPTAAAVQTVLTGNWVNTTDDKEVVQFTPTHYKTYYEGELLVEEDMVYHPICPGDCSGGESVGIPCFTIAGPAQTDCFGIIRLTDDVMELSLLGVSTETIVYRKISK